MFGFMLVIPIAEAAEQTVLQKLVPFEKQGRVFGFVHSIETASTPIAAFVVGPLATFLLIPFMETDTGHSTFGWLLGGGEARGIALTFVTASSVMLVVVLLAFSSKAYRRLTQSFDEAGAGSADLRRPAVPRRPPPAVRTSRRRCGPRPRSPPVRPATVPRRPLAC